MSKERFSNYCKNIRKLIKKNELKKIEGKTYPFFKISKKKGEDFISLTLFGQKDTEGTATIEMDKIACLSFSFIFEKLGLDFLKDFLQTLLCETDDEEISDFLGDLRL